MPIPDRLADALADRYSIERELGAGGMATVYLAHDLKHDRPVALKVLRPELAAVIGAERFLAEIRTTANLQHPHILPLHDSGEANGFVFYVMPYVEGESLRDRLAREHQLSIADAVRLATEVAGALDYAHRHGVVHRDIKPENVLLHEGQALVADFGIALAVSRSDGGTRMTETGMSLGTPHYMSPEQAMGEREITPRSDVYALGAMTYEMLLGEPPFTGPTAQSIVAKVMTEKPAPLIPRRDTVPPEVEDAVLTALAKLPADRFATAAEFAAAVNRQRGTLARAASPEARSAGSRERYRFRVAVAVAAVALVLAGFFAVRGEREGPRPVARFGVALPNLRTATQVYGGPELVLAPDGSRIVYVGVAPEGGTELWLREAGDLTPHPLAGTNGADGPFFSPDGKWIGYFAGTRLYKTPVAGGTPIALADSAAITLPAGAWLSDDQIVFTNPGFALLEVSAAGGAAKVVEPAPSPSFTYGGAVFPVALPGTERILLTECTNNCSQMTLVARDLRTHQRHVLLPNTTRGWYLPSGILVAVRQDGSVVGAPFDPGSLRLTGSVVPLLSGVRLELGITPTFSVADDGSMLYLPTDSGASDLTVARVSRTGRGALLDRSWRANITSLALSPDGRRLAVSIGAGGRSDLWVKQLDAGPLSRLTFEGTLNYRAAWRPDGRSLSFTSDRDSGQSLLYSMRADGSGRPERLMPQAHDQIDESEWSRDGRWLVYRVGVSDGERDIYARGTAADTARVTVTAGRFDEYMPALSPDGRWIAYVSVESGQEEVYVRPFPGADRARWQVSTAGGNEPVWAHSGRELLYVSPSDSLMSVAVTGTPDFHAGPPRALFTLRPFLILPFHQSYAIAPDDQSFIMLQQVGAANTRVGDLTVVLNWGEEVAAKLRGAKP